MTGKKKSGAEGFRHHLRSSFLSGEFPLCIQTIILGKRNIEAFDFATAILARLTPLSAREIPVLRKHQSWLRLLQMVFSKPRQAVWMIRTACHSGMAGPVPELFPPPDKL